MTTWDMDTVHRVRRLESTMRVDRAVLAASRTEVFEAVRQLAAAQLAEAARTFAVEVHSDDVQALEVTRLGDVHAVLLNIWRPGWRDVNVEVELRGGAADGTLFAIRRNRLHHGIILQKPMPSLNLADVDQVGPLETLMSSRTEHYQLAGWREAERRWVLACE